MIHRHSMELLVRLSAIALTLSLAAGFSACTESPDTSQSAALRPLQPLVYTEQPTLTPEASGVRERRMLRQYQQGASRSGSWGATPAPTELSRPPIRDARGLGEAIFEALVERDEAGWDALFVPPQDYAGLVRVDLKDAHQFVDTIQAASLEIWRNFEPGLASEAPEGGWGAVLEFGGLELGEGRRVDGPIAQEGETIVQYWGNILRLKLRGSDVVFELKIRKILRIPSPSASPGTPALSLGSAIKMSPMLESYARAGLHLKAELLETREYPYPLAVGNFWRYQRSRQSPSTSPQQAGEAAPGAAPKNEPAMADMPALDTPSERAAEAVPVDGVDRAVSNALAATETLLEVVSVDRYGSRRLVTLRRSYNDEALSTSYQHFLVLPKRIYQCSSRCRARVKDLAWLLAYFDRETPIYVFPLGLNEAWGAGGESEGAVFEVGSDWKDVGTPAGTYTNTVEIHGLGPLGSVSPYYRGREQTRYFAHGHGLVQRVLRQNGSGNGETVVEKLVESRIMPR